MSAVSDHHNQAAGEIVKQLVSGVAEAGGDYTAIMALLESVAAGVILFLVKEEGDIPTTNLLAEGVKVRLKMLRDMRRLRDAEPKGSA